MPCLVIDQVVDGQRITGRLCRVRRRARCEVCRAREHEVLCDGPPRPGSRRKDCSAKLCSGCALEAGPDRHLCPGHAFAVEEARHAG